MLSGKQISEARKRKGLTQEALASELGVSRQTIAKWEQEISTPSVANAYKLMDILGLQDIEKKSSIDDVESEDKKNSISKKKITKKLMIELWAIYVGIAFLCFFFIGIAALLFLPIISIVLILLVIVVREIKGMPIESPKKFFFGGICFIGLALLTLIAILASWIILRENYRHRDFYSIPATQLSKYSAINEWIDECETLGAGIYGQCIELPSDRTTYLYIVYRHQVTDASDGIVISDPLHMRFVVKYHSGDKYDGVDLYFLQGRSNYQMFFSLDGSEPYYNGMATVSPRFDNDVEALFNDMQDLSSYSVRVNGKRKNHCTTIGLKEPESVTCPSCGTQTTDITRSYILPDGFEEVACDSYQYGTDILYHYVDCYQAVCHDCPSMEDPDVLEDQTFCFGQERTLIFCEGRSHI